MPGDFNNNNNNNDNKLTERIKRFFTERNINIMILMFYITLTTVILNGEVIIKSWTFSNGDIIYANRINDNFDALFAKVNELDGKAGDGAMPVGSVIPFAGNESKLPNGWLLCDGTEYDTNTRPEYENLRGVIGNVYGGSGGTKFQVPDLRGRVVVGVNNMGGTSTNLYDGVDADIRNRVNSFGRQFGKAAHKLDEKEMPPHNHVLGMEFFKFDKEDVSAPYYIEALTSLSVDSSLGYKDKKIPVGRMNTLEPLNNNNKTEITGGSGSENSVALSFPIIQPSMTLNYIIKY